MRSQSGRMGDGHGPIIEGFRVKVDPIPGSESG